MECFEPYPIWQWNAPQVLDRVNELERGKDTVRQAGGWKTSTMVDRYAQEKAIANQGMGSALD